MPTKPLERLRDTLKTLGVTTWEKIKIDEVFALNGCFQVFIKRSDKTAMLLADDSCERFGHLDLGGIFHYMKDDEEDDFGVLESKLFYSYEGLDGKEDQFEISADEPLVKLPKSVQRLYADVL